MLAEAIHSFADCGNQALLLRGMREAKRPPDAEHPLGYGGVVYFWAFLVAILLFTVGGVVSLYEGIHKMLEPHPGRAPAHRHRRAGRRRRSGIAVAARMRARDPQDLSVRARCGVSSGIRATAS